MEVMFRKSLLVVVLLLSSLTAFAEETPYQANTLNWYLPDSPPGYIVSGPYKGHGYNDEMLNLFIEKLPQYSHNKVVASYPRAVIEMSRGTGCLVGIYPSEERKDLLHYSIVRQVVYANGLIIPSDLLSSIDHLIDDNNTISLKALAAFSKGDLIGGVAKDRIYGQSIDGYIQAHKNSILVRASNNVFSSLLEMLDSSRIDYTFGFPVELSYVSKKLDLKRSYRFIKIAEMPTFTKSYVACSKSAEGKKIIDMIDNQLSTIRSSGIVYSMYDKWLDESLVEQYRQYSNELFRQ